MQRIEITFDRRYIESLIAGNEQTPEERGRIRKIANGIISEGITNVPFGGYGVFDPDYNKHHFLIHDYFIAKGIDKIKSNGLMAVITSKGTLDKLNPSVRKYIADRAELIGAVRLPNTAFKKTANTEVVTDILFFRKREEAINANVENTEWLSTGKTEEGFEVNNYYIRHPEMVLGTFAKETGLYGAEDVTVKPDGRELSEAISEAISRLPKDFYINPEYTEEADAKEEVEVDYDVKPMNLKAVNGKVYMRVGDRMVEQPLPPFPKDAYQRIADMIAKERIASNEKINSEIENIKEYLSSSDICFTEYSDVTVRRLVEYIRVMKDNSIIIVLKGGIQIREPIETNN